MQHSSETDCLFKIHSLEQLKEVLRRRSCNLMNIVVDENMTAAVASHSEESHQQIPESSNNRSSLAVWLLIAGIILSGLVFRFLLLNAFYLDFDEAMHFQVAREASLSDAWVASRIHTHPPLVFLFYHYW